jgi:hypothetical protein
VAGIDDQWEIDLIDVRNIKGYNNGISYILCCIDVFSKFAWAKAIKSKDANECKRVFQEILLESKRKPNYLYMDSGNEFKGEFKSFCKSKNILIIPTNSKLKATIVERFNRTLKEKMWRMFTHHASIKSLKPKNFTLYLDELIYSYNHSIHRSIKRSPASVNKRNGSSIRNILYQDDDKILYFNFKIGEYVRISEDKKIFD